MGKVIEQVALVAGGLGSAAIAKLQVLSQLTRENKHM